MIRLGLIGYPLGHSLSPKIHTAALKACDLDGEYSLFPIRPDDKRGLKDLLGRVRTGQLVGLNVTIPHKQNVIELMDVLTPTAKSIGAVNTIYLREDKLIGDNTDAAGFLADMKKFLPAETQQRRDRNVLVLGAGGSARAVVYALVNDGWKVTLAARRIGQAQQLALSFAPHTFCINDDLSNIELSDIVLIVNTTPVGMSPHTDQSPWLNGLPFPDAAIYDLVYNPTETKLVSDARRLGLSATTGLGMLIEQAALAFEIWTGLDPSRDILYASVVQ